MPAYISKMHIIPLYNILNAGNFVTNVVNFDLVSEKGGIYIVPKTS